MMPTGAFNRQIAILSRLTPILKLAFATACSVETALELQALYIMSHKVFFLLLKPP